MSSATSTDGPALAGKKAGEFRPWHFFVVLTLLAATAAVLTSQRVTPEVLILLSMTIFAAGAVALAAYRTLLPLVGRERRLLGESLGHRARAALEREKQLVLRSIKELEFDRAMGKLAAEDFDEMSRRLRARAIGLMKQLDADTSAPRARIEQELADRLRDTGGARKDAAASAGTAAAEADADAGAGVLVREDAVCSSCGVANDIDARFCKGCGTRLTQASDRDAIGNATGGTR